MKMLLLAFLSSCVIEDSRSVQELQILGGGGIWPFLIIGGGLVPLNVYGGYGPGVNPFKTHGPQKNKCCSRAAR